MKINPSVVCEQVGDDVVVLDSENSAVVTLTGDNAKIVRLVLAGENLSETEPGVAELLAQGVLVSESSSGLSRRSLVMSGAAVGVGGVVALSLPAAANASSVPSGQTLEAPRFPTGSEDWDANRWTNEGSYVGPEVYIAIILIQNYDPTLTYQVRSAAGDGVTYFDLTEDGQELIYDNPAGPDRIFSGPAFLRVANSDGEFSEDTPFILGDD
jgi:hypothetical protein